MASESKHGKVDSELMSLLVGLSSDTLDGEKYLAVLNSSNFHSGSQIIVELLFEVAGFTQFSACVISICSLVVLPFTRCLATADVWMMTCTYVAV